MFNIKKLKNIEGKKKKKHKRKKKRTKYISEEFNYKKFENNTNIKAYELLFRLIESDFGIDYNIKNNKKIKRVGESKAENDRKKRILQKTQKQKENTEIDEYYLEHLNKIFRILKKEEIFLLEKKCLWSKDISGIREKYSKIIVKKFSRISKQIFNLRFKMKRDVKLKERIEKEVINLYNEEKFLKKLRNLNLKSFKIREIESNFFSKLLNLENISLSFNKLQTLPLFQKPPKKLKVFNCIYNNISSIFSFSRKWDNLVHLGLSYNSIVDLSFLENNKSNLPNLLSLDLGFNLIEDLKQTVKVLSELMKLEILILKGNPVCLLKKYRKYCLSQLSLRMFDEVEVVKENEDEVEIIEDENCETEENIEDIEEKFYLNVKINSINGINVIGVPSDDSESVKLKKKKKKKKVKNENEKKLHVFYYFRFNWKTEIIESEKFEEKEVIEFNFSKTFTESASKEFVLFCKIPIPIMLFQVKKEVFNEEEKVKEVEIGRYFLDIYKILEGEKEITEENGELFNIQKGDNEKMKNVFLNCNFFLKYASVVEQKVDEEEPLTVKKSKKEKKKSIKKKK